MVKRKRKMGELKDSLVDWAEGQAQVGTMSMVLLPSRNYPFKVSNQVHKITLTRKGTYHEIDPDFFSEEDGAFNLYDEKSKVFYLPAISKVLYAEKKYPDLKDNQLFAPIYVVIKDDTVDIFGQVIDLLEPRQFITDENVL
jgi:hypothetical protein